MIFVTSKKEIISTDSFKLWKDSRSKGIVLYSLQDHAKHVLCQFNTSEMNDEAYDLFMEEVLEETARVVDLSRIQAEVLARHPDVDKDEKDEDTSGNGKITSYEISEKYHRAIRHFTHPKVTRANTLVMSTIRNNQAGVDFRAQMIELASHYFDQDYHAGSRDENGDLHPHENETALWNFCLRVLQKIQSLIEFPDTINSENDKFLYEQLVFQDIAKFEKSYQDAEKYREKISHIQNYIPKEDFDWDTLDQDSLLSRIR